MGSDPASTKNQQARPWRLLLWALGAALLCWAAQLGLPVETGQECRPDGAHPDRVSVARRRRLELLEPDLAPPHIHRHAVLGEEAVADDATQLEAKQDARRAQVQHHQREIAILDSIEVEEDSECIASR